MALPRIDPLRPVLAKVVPRGREWIYELKLDGFRGILSIDNGQGLFTSKSSKPMPRFQDLAARIANELEVRDVVLDGEIIVMGETGPDFAALMYRHGAPAYAAFDLLWLDGRDLRPSPLWRRKKALQKLVAKSSVGYVEHVDDPALFTVVKQQDLEGVVAKKRSDPCSPENGVGEGQARRVFADGGAVGDVRAEAVSWRTCTGQRIRYTDLISSDASETRSRSRGATFADPGRRISA